MLRDKNGIVPFGKIWAYRLAYDKAINPKAPAKRISQRFFGAHWIRPDPTAPLSEKTMADFVAQVATIPPGVNVRQDTSAMYPVQIPDLIGVKDRLYLDHTGLQQQRSLVDLMRYDAINNFIEEIADYTGFRPATLSARLPDLKELSRASDRELYALALFLYSLKPPPNPNRLDARAPEGKKVFEREGCTVCHTPPLYTNNMTTPAIGFKVPEQDRTK